MIKIDYEVGLYYKEVSPTSFLSEYREVDAAILAMLNKTGMLREIIVLAVLEHEDASFCQKVFLEYYIGDGGKVAQSVWWIGKDEVELLFA